jgi:dihydrofolate reductase
MRKIVTSAFASLDGVMQAPGGPDEDRSGGFEHGGWWAAVWDDVSRNAVAEVFAAPFDLLLGRKTYDIFASYWPTMHSDATASDFDALNVQIAQRFNACTKYVATHRPESLEWQNSQALGDDVVAALRALKNEDGPRLLTQGSTALLQTLFENDLIDELVLFIAPVTLGPGKRLFGDGTHAAGFRMTSATTSSTGVLIASYQRAGDVATASFTEPATSDDGDRRAAHRTSDDAAPSDVAEASAGPR